ncbi:hypothetical protein RUM43_014807 [Polyplax serrata]|uniref:Uncharacterized protein n=1 Tax=Polyplax serrata TaxID=468196 RepID=A0AAN8S5W6_POLSC
MNSSEKGREGVGNERKGRERTDRLEYFPFSGKIEFLLDFLLDRTAAIGDGEEAGGDRGGGDRVNWKPEEVEAWQQRTTKELSNVLDICPQTTG